MPQTVLMVQRVNESQAMNAPFKRPKKEPKAPKGRPTEAALKEHKEKKQKDKEKAK